ncbi:MAG: hypothetical protein GPJ54_17240 [Candidatus Heimdallarchaeota archaeon]|nr:hypothetical protein [Candidatus Heimdallarchaeota archaeon]
MDDEFDPSLAPLPEGVLPDVQKLLRDLIATDMDQAVDYLKRDPIAVVALSKILKEIRKEKTEKTEDFKNYYDRLVLSIFSIDHLVNEYGMAFTTELLLGYWRKLNQQIHIESVTELILDNLITLNTKASKLESNTSNRVVVEMINDGLNRIQGMYNHEKNKAKEHMDSLTVILDDFVGNQFHPLPTSGIPEIWYSLLAVASMKQATAMEFRKLIATCLLKHLKLHFDKFTDEQKYVIAPYLSLLEKISNSN